MNCPSQRLPRARWQPATLLLLGACLACRVLPAAAQGFNLPSIPGLSRILKTSNPADLLKTSSICAMISSGVAAQARSRAQADARRLHLSPQQSRLREQNYLAGWAMLGCTSAATAADAIIRNMSESAKKAQADAWQQAQQQTGSVTWHDPNSGTRGTSELTEREPTADGGECGVRRDVIEAAEGRAEPMVRVCRVAGGQWEPAA